MNLNITYSTNALNNAPTAFYNAVNYVVHLFDVTFTNNVTVNIEIGYGDFPQDNSSVPPLGESNETNVTFVSYNQTKNLLIGQGAPGASTLPVNSPIAGGLVMSSAQEKALGLIGTNGSLDGWVGIASNASLGRGQSWSFDPTATPSSSQYYIVGVLEHEITEVMGRTSGLDVLGEYSLMDLYRYAAPNLRQLTAGGNPAYFSTNNGSTALDYWNNASLKSDEDLGDWAPSGPSGVTPTGADAFLSEAVRGQINGLTATDLTLMAAIGWTVAASGPIITALSMSPATGAVGLGQQVTLTLSMSSVVTVAGGTPSLTLNDGGTATYVSGSGTNALVFLYTVAAGQNTNALKVTATNLNGAAITNGAGAAANLSLTGLSQSGPWIGTSSSNTSFVTLPANASYTAIQPNVTVVGGGGTTSVTMQSSASVFLGDSGNDLVTVTGSNNTVVGSSGQTTINAAGGSAQVIGGVGTLVLNAGAGAVTLQGGTGSLTVNGGSSGTPVVYNNAAPLLFNGGGGTATVVGGSGADTVFAPSGGGQFWGGSGAMMFIGGSGTSTAVGGSGQNILFGGSSGHDVLVAGTGASVLIGTNGNTLVGLGTAGDTLVSSGGNETLVGSGFGGNDQMFANSGSDAMFGGTGNDVFVAGHGNAQMIGGTGQDLFVFSNGAVGGNDTILNFAQGRDHVGLFGYGTNVVSSILQASVISSGSTTVTLPDNTRITFANLTHLGASDFVSA